MLLATAYLLMLLPKDCQKLSYDRASNDHLLSPVSMRVIDGLMSFSLVGFQATSLRSRLASHRVAGLKYPEREVSR